MKLLQISTDKLAISLSMLCVLHCLAFPLILVLVPSIAALPLEQETFHLWMVVAVIPTSIYALTLGCKKHKKLSVLSGGLIGLAGLIAAVLFGESQLGEAGEKLLTVAGATLIALAHYKNFQLCHHLSQCPCPDSKGDSRL
ncbi:MerC domain-containing protein [Thalassomonas viridans]|uniref:MerC domain-containing protein n=1 Tax=Thalassomonas viridans TaxID=137584 RepID=A0AAE9Z2K9_9GAMM|nr:MerC domain-containing protein [Thalassomonas viridans]WDE05092.1 MerC domain-containing protein [Thalassomonas viridans]